MQHELTFVWDKWTVPHEAQAQTVVLRFDELDLFAEMADTAADIRNRVREELGVRPDAGFRAQALSSRIVNAWKSAAKRGDKRKAEGADQIANGLPRTHTKKEFLEWIAAWERAHKRELKDNETPAQTTVDKSFAELGDGELQPEKLTDVLSKEEAGEETWQGLRIDNDRSLKATKTGKSEVPVPANSEQLRPRFKLFAVKWELTRLQCPTRDALQAWTTVFG